MAISAQFTERMRQQLISMARGLIGDIESIEETTHQASGGQGASDLSNAPMHLGDMGTEEYLHQLNSALLNNETQLVQEVNDALTRIRDGNYGVCTSCGSEIVEERLAALPATPFCITCASSVAQRRTPNLNEGRPMQPAHTYSPEGEMGEQRMAPAKQFAGREQGFDANGFSDREQKHADTHAVGTPGGGDASGGLAGSNMGRGDPQVADLEDAMGSGRYSNEPVEKIFRPE